MDAVGITHSNQSLSTDSGRFDNLRPAFFLLIFVATVRGTAARIYSVLLYVHGCTMFNGVVQRSFLAKDCPSVGLQGFRPTS